MRNSSYTARRRESQSSYTATMGFVRNRNTVRHSEKSLGTVSFLTLMVVSVSILGVLFVSQGTRATSYDYEISGMETKIEGLEAQKADLEVEKARLTAIATSAKSEVAAVMEDGVASGYAE